MNSMLLLVAILFALISVAGYQLVSMFQSYQVTTAILQNQVRLQIISNQIRTGITVIGGRVAIPVSTDLAATIPSLSAFRSTTSGDPIVYCPILPDAAAGTDMITNTTNTGAETYPVETVEQNGVRYAVAGRPGSQKDSVISGLGIVAYMLSPQPNATNPLLCSDVNVADDGTTLLVKGGSVTPIFDNPASADGSSFVISPDGVRPHEALTSDRNARTLSDVVEFVKRYDVHDMRIKLFGSEKFKATEMRSLFEISFGRTFRFEGPDAVRSTLLVDEDVASVSGMIEFISKGDVIIDNVLVKGASGADVGFASSPGGSVVLDDSSVARVRSNGGSVLLTGATRVIPDSSALASASPIVADGGSITFAVSDGPASPVITAPNAASALHALGGDIVIKSSIHIAAGGPTTLFQPDNGGRLRIGTPDAAMLVDRGNGYTAETFNPLQRVSKTCADGSESCTAACPSTKRVAWGECGSGNAAPLSAFTVDATGSEYTCQWSQMSMALAPRAAVVCQTF